MPIEQLWPLVMFAFVTSFTPGPNNIMLMTSGANIGFIRTIPHMMGVTLGFSVMVVVVGIGLTGIFLRYPALHHILKVVCLIYLVWLAIKIAMSKPGNKEQEYQPMSFSAAAIFQWVNPKAWSMALTTVSVYNPSADGLGLVLIALVFGLVNLPCVSIWAAAGKQLSHMLTHPIQVRRFNLAMGGLLLVSTLPML
ncbi:LysE family translocator [Zobellella sp. An-6]|uniref:LysE family translocator n=1 Tax=Zobellella sp. An-6 TaxID=3400218 RepID=UPI0040422D7E